MSRAGHPTLGQEILRIDESRPVRPGGTQLNWGLDGMRLGILIQGISGPNGMEFGAAASADEQSSWRIDRILGITVAHAHSSPLFFIF